MEDLAFELLDLGETHGDLFAVGAVLVGFLAALIFDRSRRDLLRSEYFFAGATLLFLTTLSQFVWLAMIPAMARGILWVVMALGFGSLAVGGFFYGSISRARSRNAWGHAGYAFLGFVPIANLFLLFRRPARDVSSSSRSSQIGNNVVLGVVLLVLSTGADRVLGRLLSNAMEFDPDNVSAALTARIVARAIETPLEIDDFVTLEHVQAAGKTLRYRYVVDGDLVALPDSFIAETRRDECPNPTFSPIIQDGGAVEYVYLRPDGGLIGTVRLDAAGCAAD